MAISTVTALVFGGSAAKRTGEKIVDGLFEFAKQEAAVRLKNWKAKNHAENILKHIRQLRHVKTIMQTEKEVDLTKFYHPAKIEIDGKRKTINQLADINYDGCIVIEGIAGQGKSTFLRYLATVEFFTTHRIPVFLELRKIRQGQTLISLALQELKALGFEMDERVFNIFAKNGRILLFLDAFDELKEELRQDTITDIETLIRQNDQLRIVITSRPESGISNSPFLRIFRLCLLEGNEYEAVIARMSLDSEVADKIISGIKKESTHIANILTTPLMVSLLLVRYKIDQSLPQNRIAFYDTLFELLLQRHDKTKGGYRRPRKSSCGDAVLLEFFNALCFVTRKAHETSFSVSELNAFGKEALKIINESHDAGNMLLDVIEITCLILRDGSDCAFIHKSVQEYHCSLFIKGQPDESVKLFYEGVKPKWMAWDDELEFLSSIDRYRFTKYYYIPELSDALGVSNSADFKTGDFDMTEKVYEIFKGDFLTFNPGGNERHKSLKCILIDKFSIRDLTRHYISAVFAIDRIRIPADLFRKDESSPTQVVCVADLLRSGLFTELYSACLSILRELGEALKSSEEYVAHVYRTKDIFDFDRKSAPDTSIVIG